jgi:hypothetical protein
MKDIIAVLKKTDGRILVLAVITFFAVLFSGYQAVTAFSGKEEAPEYRRSPPAAFATPQVDTIVDPQRLTAPRLPDDAFLAVVEKSTELSKKIADQTINQQFLVQQGMKPAAANSTLNNLKSYFGIYANRDTEVDPDLQLGEITIDSAQASQNVNFGVGAGDSPPGAFTISYAYLLNNNNLKLDSIEVDF